MRRKDKLEPRYAWKFLKFGYERAVGKPLEAGECLWATQNPNYGYEPGQWQEAVELPAPCTRGYHACDEFLKVFCWHNCGFALCRVEVLPPSVPNHGVDGKIAFGNLRIVQVWDGSKVNQDELVNELWKVLKSRIADDKVQSVYEYISRSSVPMGVFTDDDYAFYCAELLCEKNLLHFEELLIAIKNKYAKHPSRAQTLHKRLEAKLRKYYICDDNLVYSINDTKGVIGE
jgi:hypothetical protein